MKRWKINYTITAKSEYNCPNFSKVVTVCDAIVPLTPCNVYDAHTTTDYTSETGGVETLKSDAQIDSVYDQNGNVYPVMQIGKQCWMAENLRTTAYSTSLPNHPSLTYNHASGDDDGKTYGYYYSWTAVMAMGGAGASGYAQGICPKGWHVPTATDLALLITNAGASGAAGKLVKGCDWYQSNSGVVPGNYDYAVRNSSGFGAFPAGYYWNTNGQDFRKAAYFWSRNIYGTAKAQALRLGFADSNPVMINCSFNQGMSVRCVREIVRFPVLPAK